MKLQVLEGSKFSIKCLWNTDLSSFGASSGMASSLGLLDSFDFIMQFGRHFLVVVEEGMGKIFPPSAWCA